MGVISAFLVLIYSNWLILGVFSGLLAYVLLCIFKVLFKDYNVSNSFIFPLAIAVNFSFQFSPLPIPLQKQLIELLQIQEENKATRNGLLNSILFSCMSDDFKGVKGMQYEDLIAKFQSDLPDGFNVNADHKETMFPESISLCEAAERYNKLRAERLLKD